MDKGYKWEAIDPIKDRLPFIITSLPFGSGHWLTYFVDQHKDFAESSLMYRHQFKQEGNIRHCQAPHELRGDTPNYHIHPPITCSMKATMARNIDFKKIALLDNNRGPYTDSAWNFFAQLQKINPKLKVIVSLDVITCRIELARKNQGDIAEFRSEGYWKVWQEKFADSVFRININKILDYDEQHYNDLVEFLDTQPHEEWQRFVKDYRSHINV